MQLKLTMLDKAEKDAIHANALEILESVGIRFGSKKVCELLQQAGCEVDWDALSARIPASLVERGLRSLPSRFTLAAPDPEKDIAVGAGVPWYTAAAQSPWFRDLETGARRPSTSRDLVSCARLVEALDDIDEWCPMVVPTDIAPELQELNALETSLLYSSKHLLGGGTTAAASPFKWELFDAFLGSRDALKDRALISYVQTPISPLQNDGSAMEVALEWADYRAPLVLQFLPLAGATSPVTLAGTIAQETANFLGHVAFYQLVAPGWPIIWGAGAGVIDMRSGRWAGMSTEAILMCLAMVEMAKTVYDVPVSVFGESSDAKDIGFQSGLDSVYADAILSLAGADNIWGPADLDGATLVDLDYLVLTTEAVRQNKRLRAGVLLDEAHFLIDVIKELRFSADYLSHKSTARTFRKEHLLSDLFARETYEDWEARGKDEAELARERRMKILEEQVPIEHPPEVLREARSIMKAAERQLLGAS